MKVVPSVVLVCGVIAIAILTEARRPSDQEEPSRGLAFSSPAQSPVKSSVTPIKKVSLTGPLDPRKTWKAFLRLSERNERRDKKRKKAASQLRSGPIYARGPIGPVGPRGPRGHRGPKGANVTKEEMFEEFRAMVREIAARKFQLSADPMCTEYCIVTLDGKTDAVESPVTELPPLFDVNRAVVVPKVVTAFLWELANDLIVPRKTLIEVGNFFRPFSAGSYERETDASDPGSGRFVAPRTGFYTFFIRMQLQLPTAEDESAAAAGDELFSVLLCIQASCQENVNLETISGSGPWHKTTVTVNGLLHLEEKQYVSVFIDNYSRFSLRVYDGSQFSGYLTGI